VAALPSVDFPTLNITGQLPGASAETMAASVASPIERQLSTIAGITSLTSSSSLGITSITIQFDLNRNIDGAALDVQTALSVAARKLPVEMTIPPSFRGSAGVSDPLSALNSRPALSVIDEYGGSR
jgi:HAE1 family hydrophobic/amphiphilic exporter-1